MTETLCSHTTELIVTFNTSVGNFRHQSKGLPLETLYLGRGRALVSVEDIQTLEKLQRIDHVYLKLFFSTEVEDLDFEEILGSLCWKETFEAWNCSGFGGLGEVINFKKQIKCSSKWKSLSHTFHTILEKKVTSPFWFETM